MLSLLTGAKSFRGNRFIGSPRLNRLGLHVARRKATAWCAEARRFFLGLRLAPADRLALARDGFVEIRDFLPRAQLDAALAELCALSWPLLEMAQPPARTLRVNLDGGTSAKAPALAAALRDPRLLRLLRYAAGCPGAPLAALQIVRTDGTEAGEDPQTGWHRDTFHPTGKAWLFLHEVPPDRGPFAYMPGSHKPNAAHLAWERACSIEAATDPDPLHASGSFRAGEAVLQGLGYGPAHVAAVPANTLVVADTSGFHRRSPSPSPTVRLELYFSLRRNPFFAGLYPSLLGLPVVRRRWAGWAYRHFEQRLAAGRPGWIPLGRRPLQTDEKALLRPSPRP